MLDFTALSIRLRDANGVPVVVVPGSCEPMIFKGISNASAAVALDGEYFLVFDDEKRNPRIFKWGESDDKGQVDIKRELPNPGGYEFDIEGATRIGDVIYAISSHGLNKRGEALPDRHRIIRFRVKSKQDSFGLRGKVDCQQDFLKKLLVDPAYRELHLDDAAKKRPELGGGINIEGLSASKHNELLVGFRGPLFGQGPKSRKALIATIRNPAEYVAKGRPIFGPPIFLNLGNRGIRDIELIEDRYFVLAGPEADETTFAIFTWSGHAHDDPKLLAELDLSGLNGVKPEVLFTFGGIGGIKLLSDDGDYIASLYPGVDKVPDSDQRFRAFDVKIEQ
jgi:hypothetical protein